MAGIEKAELAYAHAAHPHLPDREERKFLHEAT